MEYRRFLKDYGFSEDTINKLIKKGECDVPYGLIKIRGDKLITTYHATGKLKVEKMK